MCFKYAIQCSICIFSYCMVINTIFGYNEYYEYSNYPNLIDEVFFSNDYIFKNPSVKNTNTNTNTPDNYIFKLVLENNTCKDNPYPLSIHGFWPDYITSGYPEYCNLKPHCNKAVGCSRNIMSCSLNIEDYIPPELLPLLEKFWCSNNKQIDNNKFWCHEICKHACCTDLTIYQYIKTTLVLYNNNMKNRQINNITCYKEQANKEFRLVECI